MPTELFSNVIVGMDGHEGGGDALALARQLLAGECALVPAHVFFIDPRAPLFAAQIDHSAARSARSSVWRVSACPAQILRSCRSPRPRSARVSTSWR